MTGMSHAYLVEIEENTVGLVVRESDGYRFYATRRSLSSLERNLFDSATQAHRAILNLHGFSQATRTSITPLHRGVADQTC